VVVAEPASLTLPSMKPGDVLNGEFTLTNYGLIRADNLVLSLPQNDPYYRYETLGALPASLAAKGRITVPYRVVCLKAPEGDGIGTGGGCQSYSACARVDYGYTCANGADTRGSARHCWTYTYGSCGGSPPVVVPGGGGSWDVGGGTAGGTSSPSAPAPKPITGVKCFPSPIRKEAYCGDDCALSKETRQGILQEVHSQVNLVLGEYTRDHTDLSVKVPGGVIAAGRRYYANAWHFEHTRHNLVLKPAVVGTGIESIEKAGVIYTASSLDSDLFIHDTYRIRKSAAGFRWEDKSGGFKEFDPEGKMLSYGGRNGVIGRLSYAGGKIAGVSDRNNLPVLFYEWDGERIAAVRDRENRRVDYAWSDGRLSSVTDPTGAVTGFDYDGKGRIAKATDAEGREVTIGYDDYGRIASVVNALNQGHFFEYDYDESRQELSPFSS
jgi:YD repeat-containing protein